MNEEILVRAYVFYYNIFYYNIKIINNTTSVIGRFS